MPANVETMFYVREKPWHGLGVEVQEAPTSADALVCAGLNWEVLQKDVYTEDRSFISGYKINLRSTDHAMLGIVSDRYKVVQNEDAFHFTDDLLGEGVTYETAGSLQGGRKVWKLARMPQRYIIGGDEVAPLYGRNELPRRQFRDQSCYDTYPSYLPKCVKFGIEHGKACMDNEAHRKCHEPCSRSPRNSDACRGIYGWSGA